MKKYKLNVKIQIMHASKLTYGDQEQDIRIKINDGL
jgi:hypothetical protein